MLLLNHPVEMPLVLDVGGVTTHEVRIGRLNRQYALQVVGTAAPGQHQHRSRLAISPAAIPPPALPTATAVAAAG